MKALSLALSNRQLRQAKCDVDGNNSGNNLMTFKRDIKGYFHYFILEAFLLYDLISEDGLSNFWLLIGGITFVVLAIISYRCIFTPYLIINETKLLIRRDLFFATTVFIDEIKAIKFSTGLLPYGKIQMKNGSRTLFRDEYLSSEAKAALMRIARVTQ